MRRFLTFDLYGPMVSWGETAVGEIRPSDSRPTRSALLGLVAAALGYKRVDDEAHRALTGSLRFGVRVDTPGTPITDFHSTQIRQPKRGERFRTRKDTLDAPREELDTMLSYRDYRCDALYTVAAWHTGSDSPDLSEILEALKSPSFTLYLGRKACPPALPLAPELIEASSLVEALGQRRVPELLRGTISPRTRPGLYWEKDEAIAGIEATEIRERERRDEVVSRSRWAFSRRREFFASWPEEADVS